MNKQDARSKAKVVKVTCLTDEQIYKLFSPYLHAGMTVGMYYPMAGEIDILALIKLFPDIRFCFPKALDKAMDFYLYNEEGFVLWCDHTHVCQGQKVSRDFIDLIIVPVLAINYQGYRLGHGCGHYDRYLNGYQGITLSIVSAASIMDFKEEWHDIKIKVVIKVD